MKKGSLLAIGLMLGVGGLILANSGDKAPKTLERELPTNLIPSNPQSPVTIQIPGQAGTIVVAQNDPSFDGKMSYWRDPLPHQFR